MTSKYIITRLSITGEEWLEVDPPHASYELHSSSVVHKKSTNEVVIILTWVRRRAPLPGEA